MSEKTKNPTCSESIRILSEEKATSFEVNITEPLRIDEARILLHNLQVHKIELEMQNDELRRTQEKLETYSSRYFDLYDLAPVGYVTINEQGLIIEANLMAAAMTGEARVSMIMKPFVSYIHPEFRDVYYLHMRRQKNDTPPRTCELMMTVKGGKPFWARLDSTLTRSNNIQVCRIVISDITENRMVQEEISEQKNLLGIIFENAPYLMILLDEKGKVRNINRNGLELAMEDEASLLDKPYGAVMHCLYYNSESGCGKHPTCLQCPVRSSIEKTFRTGEAVNQVEGRMTCVNKESVFELYLMISTTPIRQKGEKLVLLTVIDVTERRQIEKALIFLAQCGYQSSGENFFESLARYLSESLDMEYVCIDRLSGDNLSAETVAVFNNGEFDENVKYTLKDTPCGEVVGKKACCYQKGVRQLFPKDKALQDMMAESYVGITLWGFDGKPIGLIAVIGLKPLKNPGLAESIMKLVGIRAAGELERINGNEKFMKLEQQFVQTQKMEAIGRLAGGVAHDFNNMLGVILGYSDLVIAKISPENELYNEIKEIQKAAERSRDLTMQLLTFSRQQPVSLKPVDPATLVADAEKTLKRLIGEDINLILEIEKNLGKILFDNTQMHQILINLAVNARDAMPDGGSLTIALSNANHDTDLLMANPATENDHYVLISVSDTGHGIDREILPSIFEPFFTTKGQGKGTGLGLSTIYGIVKQNNGYICVSSESGIGTTFRIFIPAIPEYGEKINGTPLKTVDIQKGYGVILLVEDDDLMLRMTKMMLGRAGYRVIAFQATDEAIVFCSENRKKIDLLLTDVVMPGMTGRDLCMKLKESIPDLKVLYMSGHTGDIITNKGILDSDVNFIQKPFTSNDLIIKIKKVLG